MDFVGKVVIVTGAAKGMGFGAAVKFANEVQVWDSWIMMRRLLLLLRKTF